jgi:hypothetical protein
VRGRREELPIGSLTLWVEAPAPMGCTGIRFFPHVIGVDCSLFIVYCLLFIDIGVVILAL